MNKSIFGLLSLLLLLIIVCIYQKTETLYALSHPIETQKKPIHKEVKAVKKVQQEILKKPLQEIKVASTTTAIIIEEPTPIVKEIIVRKEEKILKKKENFVILEKIKASVTVLLSKSTDEHITQAQSEVIISQAITQGKKDATLSSVDEKNEIVAYLLSVFNERDKALERRDEVIQSLDKMLEEALYNQRIAIEKMNNIFIEIENTQTRLIKERDEASQINPSQEKGK